MDDAPPNLVDRVVSARPFVPVALAAALLLGQALAFHKGAAWTFHTTWVALSLAWSLHSIIAPSRALEVALGPLLSSAPPGGDTRARTRGGDELAATVAWFGAAATIASGAVLAWRAGRLEPVIATALAVLLAFSYARRGAALAPDGEAGAGGTQPAQRSRVLHHRSEWHAALGCGVLLPFITWSAARGGATWIDAPILALPFVLAWAGALEFARAIGAADADEATRRGGIIARLGEPRARRHALQLSLVAVLGVGALVPGLSWLAAALLIAPPLGVWTQALQSHVAASRAEAGPREDPARAQTRRSFAVLVGATALMLALEWIIALIVLRLVTPVALFAAM